MRYSFSGKLFFIILLAPLAAQAKTSANTDWDPTVFILTTMVVVLVAANALLAIVLKGLALALWEKRKGDSGKKGTATLLVLALLLLPVAHAMAQDTMAVSSASAGTTISGIAAGDYYLLVGTIGFLLVVMLCLLLMIRMLARQLRGIPERKYVPPLIFRKEFLDVFNKSVAVEKEADIMLDHDYDGIRELDNNLPPWWKWGFVLTIVSAFIYLGYYHVWGGPLQAEEYEIAVAKAEDEKAAYLAKAGDKIDENNVTMVLDATELAGAKELFKNTCAPCHREDAGGNVGPNLTDDYWLHGGSLKDVFKSIKYGWRDKGMPPWNGNLSAKQIAGIASYVKSLKGASPANPKAAQGELFVEGGDKAIDSVSNKTEPSLTPSGTTENKNNPLGPYRNKADGKGNGTPPGKLK